MSNPLDKTVLKLLVCAPMYNEESVAAKVIEDLMTLTQEFQAISIHIVIVNDGSTDNTQAIISKYAMSPKLTIVRHEKRNGVGACLYSGLAFAKDLQASYFAFIPGNSKIVSSELKKLLLVLISEQYDYVSGSRFLSKQNNSNTPLYRKVLIRIASNLLSYCLNSEITDITCSLRIINLSKWDHRINPYLKKSKYRGEQMVTIWAMHNKLVMKEVNISVIYPLDRSYSYVNNFNMYQILCPWLQYIMWLKIPIQYLKPKWL